ncbi:MAG: dihydroorotase [Prevotella sp.]
MKTIIEGGTIVNEGRSFIGSLVIDNDRIISVTEDIKLPRGSYDKHVDATGCFVFPGVIDEHVHFREPGLTDKADIGSESRAAAFGGVTTYFEMPNTNPQTTTLEALDDKFKLAARKSHVNYSFFFGATNSNSELIKQLDRTRVPGIKLFMGASTGNMLVDKSDALNDIFKTCAECHLPLMTHCEDSSIISHNMSEALKKYGSDPDIRLHPVIRSAEACYKSSALAVKLARHFGTRLHIAHISTADELALLDKNLHADSAGSMPPITGEAVLAHLLFSAEDYATKGTLIKCNPAVKGLADREALRRALTSGRITCIGTDHAPHQLSDKQGGCARASSGMPMIQFSLVSMLSLVDEGVLSMERLVWLMCHNPARLFGVCDRGFLRVGYKADITIVKKGNPWKVTENVIQSKCKWSPLMGEQFSWRVAGTFCNGHHVYDNGLFDGACRGEEVVFRR